MVNLRRIYASLGLNELKKKTQQKLLYSTPTEVFY